MSKLKLFSERKGIVKPSIDIQINRMDDKLRIKLWNLLLFHYYNEIKKDNRGGPFPSHRDELYKKETIYFELLWHHFFYREFDQINEYHPIVVDQIKKDFFTFEWNVVYDFIEFTAKAYPDVKKNANFIDDCNVTFEDELSGYRFVAGIITDITCEEEIESIEKAASIPVSPTNVHMRKAIELYSDKLKPDYPNSIKEAISAVESLCQLISGNSRTLGENIKGVASTLEISDILRDSLSKLYGFCNVEPGVRHGTGKDIVADADEAKFMIVSCSAWINFLYQRSEKNQIKLRK